jgi:lysophospholipase L1-like esterase
MFRFAASFQPQNLRPTLRQAGLVALACSASLMLYGCGGGNRAKDYAPDRVVSFGDENSAIEPFTSANLRDGSTNQSTLKGLTYTANVATIDSSLVCADTTNGNTGGSPAACAAALANVAFPSPAATIKGYQLSTNVVTVIETGTDTVSNTTVLQRSAAHGYFCNSTTIWIQAVAHNFGKGYQSACPVDYAGAQTYATAGAKVADVAAQVAAHRGELGSGVLVTLMAGQNDITEVFEAVKAGTMTEASAQTELANRAAALAGTVQDVISTGAKVVLALTPDLSESPYGYASGNQALLATLTHLFNDTLYISKLGNVSGRNLAGVNPVSYTNTGTRSTSYVYSPALCDLSLVTRPDGSTPISTDADYGSRVKYCNNYTYVSGGSVSTYMWADDKHFAPLGHGLIGTAAATRVANQF